MTRRIGGIVAAVLLAAVGTVALVAYVNTAERRALAGQELVEVYVVTTPISGGTAADEIENLITVEQVPLKVRARGAVESLRTLAGTVAAVNLVPGEQLVADRFVARSEFADRAVGVEIPDDLVEITVELEPQRAVGGLLEAGQTVAVYASFDPFQLSRTVIPVDGEPVPVPESVADELEGTTPNITDALLRKILVTAVQDSAPEPGLESERFSTAPNGTVFVTLAVSPFDAERLVFTAEFGSLWLAAERDSVPERDDPGQTRGSVLLDGPEAQ